MAKKVSTIELLRRANQGAVLETSFQIPIGDGNFIDAKLTAPDAMRIWEESDLERRAVWAKAEEKGLVGKPINRVEWDADLERMTPEERELAEQNPPVDQAEQFARRFGGINVLREIIPRHLRDTRGEYLFGEKQDREDFVRIMFYNQEILRVVSNAYVELTRKINQAREAIKN
ncbi:MAG TPA: hypothetical protein PKN24_15955 [bacterium]|nr:hypothetical protein [bacterium]